MSLTTCYEICLIASALLGALVAGFLLAFALVVMPGLKTLDARQALLGFQAIDGVIQKGQPLFGMLWAGSLLSLLLSLALGLGLAEGGERLLLAGAAIAFLLGVQAPTAVIHLPLNRQVQQLPLKEMTESALQEARERFEPRWIAWNRARTAAACAGAFCLLLLVRRL